MHLSAQPDVLVEPKGHQYDDGAARGPLVSGEPRKSRFAGSPGSSQRGATGACTRGSGMRGATARGSWIRGAGSLGLWCTRRPHPAFGDHRGLRVAAALAPAVLRAPRLAKARRQRRGQSLRGALLAERRPRRRQGRWPLRTARRLDSAAVPAHSPRVKHSARVCPRISGAVVRCMCRDHLPANDRRRRLARMSEVGTRLAETGSTGSRPAPAPGCAGLLRAAARDPDDRGRNSDPGEPQAHHRSRSGR